MSHVQKTVSAIRAKFSDAVEEVIEFRGETTVVVKKAALVEVCRFLHDDPDLNYNYLADLAATDAYPDEPRFAVSLIPYAMAENARFRIKVYTSGDEPELPS